MENFRFDHSAAGWKKMRQKLAPYGCIAIAVETNRGAAVQQLLEAGMEVYPVNPKSAQRYRERKAPGGVKDDALDAWSLADALRLDGQGWGALVPADPLIEELRLLCRDEIALIEQRTALVNQLQAGLRDYYPAALEAFDDWTKLYAWRFIESFPTPEKLAPRLLSEIGTHRDRFQDPQSLQCYAGTAPVTIQSGQIRKHRLRHACDLVLRSAVHPWADHSRKSCAWAQAYYHAHRAKGQSHACALRCLGHRWLKILWKMWQTRTPYDEALHTRNQTSHGSWVLQFKPA